MKLRILTLGLALGLTSLAHGASYAPVPLTANSFTYDCVVESNAVRIPLYCISVNIDNGPNYSTGGDGWFERLAFNTTSPNTNYGLPPGGQVFTNASLTNHLHLMQSYLSSNVLFLGNWTNGVGNTANTNFVPSGYVYSSGNLTVTDPTNYTALSFLTGAGGGGTVMNVTVAHADGTNEVFNNVKDGDWFTTVRPLVNTVSGVITTNQWAWLPNGRINASSGALDSGGQTSGSHLYSWDLGLADTVSPVTNVSFVWVSGGNTMVFGISGSIDNTNFAPLASVTGFNAGGVVPSCYPLPYNATMDEGTNITRNGPNNGAGVGGNTWYEKGWDPAAPTTGFPYHGTTITGFTGRPYQMAPSYAGPMAALVDTNHQLINITPQTPLSYTAFSLLVSGGNIGGANIMTNILIMQHDDGSNETNFFFGYDWFNNNSNALVQPGYIANGRTSWDGSRGLANVNSGDPRMFETQFVLQNSRSPVTNMQVIYYNPAKTLSIASTTFIFAVSATAGGIPLVFNTNTLAQNVYSGGTATFTASVTAAGDRNSAPHFQWLYSATEYGTFNLLSDGGAISGSHAASLVISGVGGGNVGYYQCVITNTVSTNISIAAPLTLLVSTAADISQPSDSTSSFGGATSGGGAPGAIDGTLSAYVNAGSGGGVFSGPVGFVTTPSSGNTVVTAMRFFAAASLPAADPADYLLEGSLDGVNFTTISSGVLALSDVRNENLTDPIDVTDQILQEVDFVNSTGYNSYRVTFNNVKTNASAASLQVSEVQLLGTLSPYPPGIIAQPSGSQKLFVGETFNASVKVNGPSPYYYTWFDGVNPLSGQTNATLTLNNVQLSDSGTYSCTISNIYGATNSATVSLTVLARPAGYASTILADNPIAFWRLDEGPDNGNGNNGTIANDYVGSHNGFYTNVLLGVPGYNPPVDPDTAVAFNQQANSSSTNPSYVGGVTGINFQSPTNVPKAFSIEAWMQGVTVQVADGGIVSMGIGSGGEQFNLDAGGTAHAVRFFFRDAAGNTHPINTSISTSDNQWHHLIVTVDEVNSNMCFYHNGQIIASNTLAGNLGVLTENSPTNLFYIGSRPASPASVYPPTNLFQGNIDEVSIYNYSLSAAQAQAHFFGADLPPVITLQPTNITVAEGTTAAFYSAAYGTPTLAYQWWNSGGSTPTTPLSGQISSNLFFNNVPASQSGNFYQLVVSNAFGSVTSAPVQLTVVSGPPQIIVDLKPTYVLYADTPLVLSVQVGGSQPFTYGWSYNGTPLANDARTSGAGTAALTINPVQVADSGNYQLFITNSQGVGQGALANVTVVPSLSFNGAGIGWAANSNGSGANGYVLGTNAVQLTSGVGSEAFSTFFSSPVYIAGFQASFIYQDVNFGGADGAAFVVQNDPRGAAAIGAAGGGLGYGASAQNAGTSIAPSAALEFNLFTQQTIPQPVGIAFQTNGVTGTYSSPGAVLLSSGDPIAVSLTYLNGTASLTMTDAVAGTSFSTSLALDIPGTVGGTSAYVGFTGADGGVTSIQTISNFTFVSLAPLSIKHTSSTVTLSWPLGSGGYQVQSTPSINPTTWTTLTNEPTALGGNNQLTLPVTPGTSFYRLINP